MTTGSKLFSGSRFVAYTYSYPHKTAYRTLTPPIPLNELWGAENRDSLFFYLHVPFCEFRCGFCNLFTEAKPAAHVAGTYLAALQREANEVSAALGEHRFAQMAIGGGTPTFLSLSELTQLFDLAAKLGADASMMPCSIEASPATLSRDKLALLAERGVERLSLGVQSFDDRAAGSLGRPQTAELVRKTIDLVRQFNFPILNLDLIYGGNEQTSQTWRASVTEAIAARAEEIYLYPLYVRDLTGLANIGENQNIELDTHTWDDQRLQFYREGRELLLTAGYRQTSMRMFEASHKQTDSEATYRCQSDGMVGLGCGARSYTSALHYATEYAVAKTGVQAILQDYIARDQSEFGAARHGFRLDANDQRRRYLLMSLLPCAGLHREEYMQRFGDDVLTHFPRLHELVEAELATVTKERVQLTPSGIEYSDALGPWLYSKKVAQRMEAYECR